MRCPFGGRLAETLNRGIILEQTMKHTITIPDDLYKELAKIAYKRGFDIEFFIIQLLTHDAETWQKQLSFIIDPKQAIHGEVTPFVVEKLPPKGRTGIIPKSFKGEVIEVKL